jgi:hypothetical protein
MSMDKQMTIWVDLWMLVNAECLVLSASGFSYAALWASNTTCIVTMHDCLWVAEKRFKDVSV